MGDPAIGWIAAIIIGGIAGWLAEQFMKSEMGLVMNIVLGIVGAAIASAIFSFFGIALGGWIGYLIAGFIGACLLIWIVRALRGRTAGTRRNRRLAIHIRTHLGSAWIVTRPSPTSTPRPRLYQEPTLLPIS
jgi:uncharacterized membrane protein YeaQ/YmgE (transglycosylase-associated protein family)